MSLPVWKKRRSTDATIATTLATAYICYSIATADYGWKESEAVISDWYLDSNIHSIAPARH